VGKDVDARGCLSNRRERRLVVGEVKDIWG
jgi:hypothetical protein